MPARSLQDGVENLAGPCREVATSRWQAIEPSIQAHEGDGNVAEGGEDPRQVADPCPATVLVAAAVPRVEEGVLDVTMNEDNLRNRTGAGPENLAVMRRLALSLARVTKDGQARSMRGNLKRAGWDHRQALKLTGSAGFPPECGEFERRWPCGSPVQD